MVKASAPGKFILFGEHAVVYGKAAIALAVDMRTEVSADYSSSLLIDGKPLKAHRSFYIREIMRRWGGKPVSVDIDSNVPPSSGLGSSAALTVAMLGAMLSLEGSIGKEEIAKEAFEVEYKVQDGASPTDTSTSTLGGAVYISPEKEEGLKWTVEKNGRVWNIHSIETPELGFVVGYTGVHAPTKKMVMRVRKAVESHPSNMEKIERIGEVTMEGREALKKGDVVRIGELMDENHSLLRGLGVSCKRLEKLINAVKDTSYGAKLTGSGGGGSMIALTDRLEEAAEKIKNAGGTPYIVRVDKKGLIRKL